MTKRRGFIALMSAVIISAILLTVVVGGSLTGIYSRFNILDAESKERSSALADACVDTLLLQLATSGVVTAGFVTVSGSDQCEIKKATSPYEVQAIHNNSHTNVLVEVDPVAFTVTKWQELAHF